MRNVIHSLALVGFLFGAAFVLSGAVGFHYHDPLRASLDFVGLGALCLVLSLAAWWGTRAREEIGRRHAVLIVNLGWLLACLLGALPYRMFGTCPDGVSSLFESVSGLTTTGASVLSGLESIPRSILFWRSLTHFLGGVGILIMFVAILPFVGTGASQLYRAESTGLFSEKITARIADTARIVLSVYLLLNLLCALTLRLAGLSWFDAVCHAFGTIATGGFSTRSDSVAAFHSPVVEWVITLFMFLSGVSFVLHYRALRGSVRRYARNGELRLYVGLCVGASLLSALFVIQQSGHDFASGLRGACFQTVSLFSTTGFTTVDYDLWPNASKVILLALMIVGACSGSTSGAIKCVRILVVAKAFARKLRSVVRPTLIETVKLDGVVVDPARVDEALGYVVTYMLILAAASFALSLYTPDNLTAVSAVVACLGGVGPGLGGAGPTETFAQFPAVAKIVLMACMLLGRLEVYVCVALFHPDFWRK